MQRVEYVDMDDEVKDIVRWLQKRADELKLEAKIHGDLARRDKNWIVLPVRIVGEMGAWERAEPLQDLEDQWEAAQNDENVHLSLYPAAA